MSEKDNPFGAPGQYPTTLSYGAAENMAPLAIDPAAPPLAVKDTTTATFTADVIQESRKQPVLVDFWAPWCGPCKQLQPALEKAVAAAGGRVRLVKMNIDEHPAIAGQLGIQSIPAVIAFKNGQPVDGFMGAVPDSQIRDFIAKLVGPDAAQPQVEEAIAAAKQAHDAGDPQTAMEIYAAVLQEVPDHVEALGALAGLLLDAGDATGAEEVMARAPADKQDAPALAAIRTRMALAAEAEGLGNPVELESRLARDPKDHQARFDLAMIRNAEGRRDEAADNLLAIIKADRTWNDDGARAQLLKLFEAWGMTDEATLAARRKLSSLLFS